MRNVFQAVIALAAVASAATASAATNLVTNGDFEAGYEFNTQFNSFFNPTKGPTGWTSATFVPFNLYFDGATATTVDAQTQYGSDGQRLAASFFASPTGGKFVALDGDTNASGPLTQTITGLTSGKKYSVAFDWGASQLQNREGATTEQLVVGFGAASQSTAVVANASQGFSGWMHETFTFTATGSSQLLSFLSLGTPVGLPPIAVLDGVSVTAVPEPATWGLMVAGFALVGVAVRRRARGIVLA